MKLEPGTTGASQKSEALESKEAPSSETQQPSGVEKAESQPEPKPKETEVPSKADRPTLEPQVKPQAPAKTKAHQSGSEISQSTPGLRSERRVCFVIP